MRTQGCAWVGRKKPCWVSVGKAATTVTALIFLDTHQLQCCYAFRNMLKTLAIRAAVTCYRVAGAVLPGSGAAIPNLPSRAHGMHFAAGRRRNNPVRLHLGDPPGTRRHHHVPPWPHHCDNINICAGLLT